MKNSWRSVLLAGLILTSIMSTAEAQDSNKKQNRKTNNRPNTDSSSSRRIEIQNKQPNLQKTDTLPVPKPAPVPVPIPRPDTMSNRIK